MATNPMQRKARNSFLLGMLLMLLIAALVVGLLLMQLKNYQDKEKAEIAAKVSIYILNQDVKSGQIITSDMLTQQQVNKNLIPQDAIGDAATLENYVLEDKEGNTVFTKNSTQYIRIDSKEYELKTEEATGSYYINKTNDEEDKQYIELNTVPVVAKVSMNKNTVLTRELVAKGDNTTSDDVRKQEYNMISLPTQIESGDYIDIRLALPSGQDYIVVAKKEVTVPDIAGTPSEDTIWVNLSEAEIIMMNNAIVEAYRINGAKLYANMYTEAGMQAAATTTYVPNKEVAQLIQSNPNIIERAKQGLLNRFNAMASERNNAINGAIQNSSEDGDTNVKTKVEQDQTNTKDNRKKWLDGLSGGNTTTAQ